MELIESRETRATANKVWSTWRQSNYWDLGQGQKKSSFEKGQKGRVMKEKKRGPAFEVVAIEEGKSFTLGWKAPFVKFDMQHIVEPTAQGSKIIYKMKLRGLMAYPMRLLLGQKIRRTLRDTLHTFIKHVE